MRSSGHCTRIRKGEDGYILMGVLILVAVFMILLAVAIPKLKDDIRRDQEEETIRRGQQYVRALQLFYRRFHRFPTSIDELEGMNGLRFLRRRYADPLTHSDDWKPVFLGHNNAPLSMGYFGQVLNAGTALPSPSAAQNQVNIMGTPPASAFDSFSSGESGKGDEVPQGTPSMPFGLGPIIGVRPSKTMASIIVYKTKSNYDEWEFVYDPVTDPTAPKWGAGTTYVGAPGVPNNP